MLTPVLVVAIYLGVTYHPPATTYQVVMSFTAGETPAGLSVDYGRYYIWLSSEYVANGLADVARTEKFAEAVAERVVSQGPSQGRGRNPVFWFTAECSCVREKTGVETYKVTLIWKHLWLCMGCYGPYTYESTSYDSYSCSLSIMESDRENLAGGWFFTKLGAQEKCKELCKELN